MGTVQIRQREEKKHEKERECKREGDGNSVLSLATRGVLSAGVLHSSRAANSGHCLFASVCVRATAEDTSFTTLNFLALTSGAHVAAEAHRLLFYSII